MGARGLLKMVVALSVLMFGAMLAVGDGPQVAMGSDEPEMTAAEMAALGADTPETVTKAEDTPVQLATSIGMSELDTDTTAPLIEAALAVAPGDAEPAVETTAAPRGKIGVVIGRLVNVRSGPSTTYGVMGQVVRDQKIEIIELKGNGWAHIRVDGRDGYMSGDFIKELPQG
ncbi:SH3 domain-containing protein [Vannielia sp.]|uniref:SH3 domain-containing protein n=1 Tax=Vannielia sp. TaxID=2813045 RepID=UPI0026050EFA|nr:SH3 domain-containing protein [Vannielia sp.]MDF1873975.1 SH3 domain-containing protein [Vannielia sp.]